MFICTFLGDSRLRYQCHIWDILLTIIAVYLLLNIFVSVKCIWIYNLGLKGSV